jgi:hypothetical protein
MSQTVTTIEPPITTGRNAVRRPTVVIRPRRGWAAINLRELWQAAQTTLAQVRQASCSTVCLEGDDEAAEILRLTCAERGVRIEKKSTRVPLLCPEGTSFTIRWPDSIG